VKESCLAACAKVAVRYCSSWLTLCTREENKGMLCFAISNSLAGHGAGKSENGACMTDELSMPWPVTCRADWP
jgi:hypothetical protein